jgi:PTH1 family peptidyl-tRNA hydrolase
MYLVAGLGNPGNKYTFTRHNAGFLAIDFMSQKRDFSLKASKHKALIGEGRIGSERVIFAKPQTFMNSSGEAIRSICDFYKIPSENVIIIYDDISLDVGTLRVRTKGSAGGHNGIKSIISHLNTDIFPRFKIGVGDRPSDKDLVDHVLGAIPKAHQETLFKVFERVNEGIEEYIKNGAESTMNKCNGTVE